MRKVRSWVVTQKARQIFNLAAPGKMASFTAAEPGTYQLVSVSDGDYYRVEFVSPRGAHRATAWIVLNGNFYFGYSSHWGLLRKDEVTRQVLESDDLGQALRNLLGYVFQQGVNTGPYDEVPSEELVKLSDQYLKKFGLDGLRIALNARGGGKINAALRLSHAPDEAFYRLPVGAFIVNGAMKGYDEYAHKPEPKCECESLLAGHLPDCPHAE